MSENFTTWSVQKVRSQTTSGRVLCIDIETTPLPTGCSYVCGHHFHYTNSASNPFVFEPEFEEDTALIDCHNGWVIDVHGAWLRRSFFVRAVVDQNWEQFFDEREFHILEEAAEYAVELAGKYAAIKRESAVK